MKVSAVTSFKVPQNVQKEEQVGKAAVVQRSYAPIPLNLHKNQILFGRSIKEHDSWGATINKNGTVNFKTATFTDAKKVYVEVLKNENVEDITHIWERPLGVERGGEDPSDERYEVTSIKPHDKNSQIFELENRGGGVFETKNIQGLRAGQPYRLVIVDKDNHIENVKDPYSKEQRQVMSWSIIHNPDNYKWTDDDWMAGKVQGRVSRRPESNFKDIGSLRIYEMSIPTITPEGDFKSAKKAVKEVADKKLANAIEFLPFENCFSKQWGYDGVDKLAINERLGTSAELKELIDYTHSLGLNVIIDMVPNHVGTDGDTLRKSGPYERGDGNFGAMLNYEGKDNKEVRNWIANAALNWAREYHADGLRLDMTKTDYMGSDFTLKQIVTEVNEHCPDVFMIAEDGMNNRVKLTTPINSTGNHVADLDKLDKDVESVRNGWGIPRLDDIGFNSEWDFVFYHQLDSAIRNSGDFDIYQFDAALRNSDKRVSYPFSHDEQGNLDGTSFVTKRATDKLGLYYSTKGSSPADIGQKAAHATQHLLEIFATGEINKIDDNDWGKIINDLGITRFVSKDEVKNAYYYAVKKAKLAMGTTFSFPGPKMFFQGIEKASLDYFKFFRDFSTPENQDKIRVQKGYDTSTAKALKDSLPDRIKYSGYVKNTMNKVEDFSTELGKFVDENPALQDGKIVSTVVHPQSLVHAVHCKKDDNEIFSVKNFSDTSYDRYGIVFPPGEWAEFINSSDSRFAGSGNYMNYGADIYGDGHNNKDISISSNSVTFFKRIG